MKFAFEHDDDEGSYFNFVNNDNVNDSGIPRFGPCPITTTMVRYAGCGDTFENIDNSDYSVYMYESDEDTEENYIISSGVNHSPGEWCGPDSMRQGAHSHYPDRLPVFDCLNPKYLRDLKSGKAMLLLDQSHEGYQTDWLWSWFHNECGRTGIPASGIAYVTGNLLAKEQYVSWANTHRIQDRLLVLPYTHFEAAVSQTIKEVEDAGETLPTFADHLKHKEENPVLAFNALQKRIRAHRCWLYKRLHDAKLLDAGLCSMNEFVPFNTWMEDIEISKNECKKLNKGLPRVLYDKPNNEHDDLYYITRFNTETVLDSYVSVVSEASFGDLDQTCFLSEKTFKSIAEMSPFIVFGNRRSLEFLRGLGYKTFAPMIDETYDTSTTFERLDLIINELDRINKIEDKIAWYKDFEDVLNFNREVLRHNTYNTVPPAMVELDSYYKEYFQCS